MQKTVERRNACNAAADAAVREKYRLPQLLVPGAERQSRSLESIQYQILAAQQASMLPAIGRSQRDIDDGLGCHPGGPVSAGHPAIRGFPEAAIQLRSAMAIPG